MDQQRAIRQQKQIKCNANKPVITIRKEGKKEESQTSKAVKYS